MFKLILIIPQTKQSLIHWRRDFGLWDHDVGEVYGGPRRSQERSKDVDIIIYFLANYREYNVLPKGRIIL